MKPRVAPTSFIVWMVKRRANTLTRTVLLMSTNEMNSNSRMNTPSTIEIRARLVVRASTIDCCTSTSSTSGDEPRAFVTKARLSFCT